MNVLMLSGDKNMLREGTDAHTRFELQRSQVDRLDVFAYSGFWSGPRGFFEILSAVKKVKYDVITVQEPFWRGLLALIAARTSGARLNVQVHADLKGVPLLKYFVARFVLARADSIRASSERVAEEVKRIHPKAGVDVLPIFIDTTRLTPKSRSLEKPFHKTILWVGRFEEEKDPLSALAVLEEILKYRSEVGLVMLGAGSLEPLLKKDAKHLPVQFPGWRTPAEFMVVSDVVISTSPFESYGASIVEALYLGIPVVSLDVGVAKEAGAHVVTRDHFVQKVLEVLDRAERGTLKLALPKAEEWAKLWRVSL